MTCDLRGSEPQDKISEYMARAERQKAIGLELSCPYRCGGECNNPIRFSSSVDLICDNNYVLCEDYKRISKEMSSERLFCPDVMREDNRCSIYENWVEQMGGKDRRMDVIYREGGEYHCLAFVALQDPITEGGVSFNDELKERIEGIGTNVQRAECMNIKLLNKSEKINKKR